jgi:hypothetical protein
MLCYVPMGTSGLSLVLLAVDLPLPGRDKSYLAERGISSVDELLALPRGGRPVVVGYGSRKPVNYKLGKTCRLRPSPRH